MSYTATWVLILISWLIIWRWCAHYYTAKAAANRMAVSGSQPVAAPVSVRQGAAVEYYAAERSKAIQGLVGLGYRRTDCEQPVRQAQDDLIWADQPVTTEALLRAVLAKRAASI